MEHVADFWSDPLTASGSQSNDGKAAYVQVYLRGNMGETLANESVDAVRDIVAETPAPPGIKAYVTGGAAADRGSAPSPATRASSVVTLITLVVIAVMLLIVYRSVVTMILVLLMVFVELGAARGIVAFLGYHEIIGLSTFATSLLTLMVIAAGTDYAIFLIGRYQEARGAGEDRESAYYTMFHGTAHVVLGSGLTIAGAMLCLSFTRLPYFQTMGVPCAVGTFVAVIAALTLGPGGDPGRRPLRRSSNPSAASSPAGGAASAPPSCGGPARFWSRRSRWHWSVCSRCPATRPTTTTATTCPTTCPPTSGTPPPTGTSTPPG